MKGYGVFSSKTDDWQTPKAIYDCFMANGYIDPCPYQSKVDNLKTDMGGGGPFYKSTI